MKTITKAFKKYLAVIGMKETEIMAPLAGINELRDIVDWANSTREDEHDYMTPLELIAKYRKLKASGEA